MESGQDGKVAAVTGAAAGARVVMVDRDAAALRAFRDRHGGAAIPLVIDLLDAKDCAMTELAPPTQRKIIPPLGLEHGKAHQAGGSE
jgi:NADP-dependent 3-hydroxy acid dehydrogenase YdfG